MGNYKYAGYFKKHNLEIRRYVQEGDDITHVPDIQDGYVVSALSIASIRNL